jgi:superfamily II DNA/RNA helicase
VSVVVLDEADQMADMGFLPQVERILNRIEKAHQTLLFSATLDGDVDRLVRKYQTEPVFHEAPTPEDEATVMLHRFVGVNPAEKVAVAAAIASGPERTLFFVRTQRAADRLAFELEREGVVAGRLHGRLSQPQRDRALQAFITGDVRVLVATNIAARGIHVDGVDIVVHFDPPEDAKTYLHRSGRTARAGASGVVVTLVTPAETQEVLALRRDAGVREAIVPMSADDRRLAALAAWSPPLAEPQPRRRDVMPARTAPAAPRAAGRNGWGRPGGGVRRGTVVQRQPAATAVRAAYSA